MFYIGRFPEPYGGVTIKNEMLFNVIASQGKIFKFDTSILKKKKIVGYIKLIIFIMNNKNKKGYIGVSSYSLVKLLRIINFIAPDTIKNIKVFAMGGNLHKIISNKKDIEILSRLNRIYVEVYAIKDGLSLLGINNVQVIPNCRLKPHKREFVNGNEYEFKCLFLSRISKEKGVNIIFEANNILENYAKKFTVDFYGHIDENFKEEFLAEILKKDNLSYNGIIDSSNINIYSIINKYDVLLFPTIYAGEGFPGILTEAKIAGIPCIVTDWNYNSSIINNNKDGIVLSNNNSKTLAESIKLLINDIDFTKDLRYGSFCSGEKYFIEKYKDEIVNNW